MPKEELHCEVCRRKGQKTKIRFSRLTGVGWCHNCMTKTTYKREFVITQSEHLTPKKVLHTPQPMMEIEDGVFI